MTRSVSSRVVLINQTGGLKRPMTSVQTLKGIRIRLCRAAARAKALRSGTVLPLTRTRTGVAFRLPELSDYEVVEIV